MSIFSEYELQCEGRHPDYEAIEERENEIIEQWVDDLYCKLIEKPNRWLILNIEECEQEVWESLLNSCEGPLGLSSAVISSAITRGVLKHVENRAASESEAIIAAHKEAQEAAWAEDIAEA